MRRVPELLLLALLAAPTFAQPPRGGTGLQGPVAVTANHAEWFKGGAMSYRGNVTLSSQTLILRGEQLDLTQTPGGRFEARVSGEPARLDHEGEGGNPPVAARARRLTYDAQRQYVQMDGAVQLERGTDRMSGENIRYEIAARRIQATGAGGAQVKIEVVPPPRESGPAKKPGKGRRK